jgi:hypothetical protein
VGKLRELFGWVRSKPTTAGQWLVRAIVGLTAFAASLVIILAAFHVPPFNETQKDPLSAAARKITKAGSSELDVTLRIGDTWTRGHGAMDYAAQRGRLDYDSGLALLLSKPYLYLRSGRESLWCRYDVSNRGAGVIFGALTGFSSDPAGALINLNKAGDYHEVGDEVLFGVRTTHYAGIIDLFRTRERSSSRYIRLAINQFRRLNPGMELPVDIWLSSDHVVRRLSTTFKVAPKKTATGTYDFWALGTPVHVRVPPSEDVVGPGKHGCWKELPF